MQLNRRTEALSLAAKAGEPDPLFEYVLVVGLQKDDCKCFLAFLIFRWKPC